MMSVELSMGAGMTTEQTEYQVQSFETTRRWARSKLSKVTAMENVKIITGLGDSMSGLYEDGDTLFCDTGVSKVDIDAVFAFRYHDEPHIKRVQRIPGGRLKMISDNPKYEPFVVDHGDRNDFEVLDRIVGTLNFNEV
jgi:phage repressor protein C with HTH and peptisase S24 domain